MKAKIIVDGGSQFLVRFEPENDDERMVATAFCQALDRPHMVSFRGYRYMAPDVDFLVQPMPSRD